MDAETANVLRVLCYTSGAFGGVAGICFWARQSFLKRKSDNETYTERVKADTEAEKEEVDLERQRLDISRQRIELMSSPQYQEYLDRRGDTARELLTHIEKWDPEDNASLKIYLDAIVGDFPL